MPKMPIKPCNQIFEKIYSGEKQDQITYRSDLGVMVVLAYRQATEGHSLIVPTEECQPTMALLSPDTARKVTALRAATKLWLTAAFDPEYVGGLDAGKEVRHAHAHEIPCYGDRDWVRVMGAPDPQPFAEMSADRAAEVYETATFHPAYAAALDGILSEEAPVSGLTLQEMAYDLATPITPRQ